MAAAGSVLVTATPTEPTAMPAAPATAWVTVVPRSPRTPSGTPVTVTVRGVNQSVAVKVTAPLTVATAVSRLEGVTVTGPVGAALSAKVQVSVRPSPASSTVTTPGTQGDLRHGIQRLAPVVASASVTVTVTKSGVTPS